MTNQEYLVNIQKIKEIYVRLSILNQNDYIVDRIEGYVVNGNISIDSSSNIRRTLSMQVYLKDNFIPIETSLIWFNKKVKVEIGVKDIITNEIIWFKQGIFLYKTADVNYSPQDKTLEIRGLDKMSQFTNDFNLGYLGTTTQISLNTPITQAIKSVIQILGLENKYLIENINDNLGNLRVTPYTIEKKLTIQYMI